MESGRTPYAVDLNFGGRGDLRVAKGGVSGTVELATACARTRGDVCTTRSVCTRGERALSRRALPFFEESGVSFVCVRDAVAGAQRSRRESRENGGRADLVRDLLA